MFKWLMEVLRVSNVPNDELVARLKEMDMKWLSDSLVDEE